MVSLNSKRLAGLALVLLLPTGLVRAETKWHTNMAEAEKVARELDVPLVLHFYADWCGPCRGMERNVLHTGEVGKRLGTSVVAVKVNSDKHRDLVSRYNVRALPSDVVLDPAGKLLMRSEGAKQAFGYASLLDRSHNEYEKLKAVRIASESKPKPDTPTAGGPPEITPREPADPTAVAATQPETKPMLDGYSPVTLASSRQWIAGSPEFAVNHKGMRYLLTSHEELEAFKSEPEKYAPQLLGCDPVLLYESDRAHEGSTEYGAFFDGRLFLFTSADTRNKFRKSPYRYTKTQHVLRADQVTRLQ